MKTFNSEKDIFVNKYSDIDVFCVSARMTVEQFIKGCKVRNLMPSYDLFLVWMNDATNSIT